MKELVFEEVTEEELFADYTADCSGSRSDCCTRVCTRNCNEDYTADCSGSRSDCCTRVCTRNCNEDYAAEEEDWGNFLEVEGGVIQY